MRKPELLAPAGDLEKLKIALMYGADAVFIGGKQFSLRARASNFGIEEIKEACLFAHQLGKKVYVTTNIIPHTEDLDDLLPYLKALEEAEVDAIICASSSIIDVARKHTNLEIHLSTQQSITNHKAVEFWVTRGVKRIVLARELSLDELRTLRSQTDADLEVFIHGGMCVSYSGKCTLSNNMTDRDANRGGCAHSCRWNYDLFEEDDKKNHIIPFAMSSKDLQSIRHISSLIDIGVESLKIEGRMKSIHYIATVVKTYRKLIDEICDELEVELPKYLLEIKKAENRLTSHGFMEGMTTVNEQLYNLRSEQPTQAFIGLVLDYDEKTQIATIEQRNYFETGDLIEVFTRRYEAVSFIAPELMNENGEIITIARHPKEVLKLKIPMPLKPFDMIRKVQN
ncbi:MAG: peptidase U32 family protein [Candidatus Izemoplasmataceae bacterium]